MNLGSLEKKLTFLKEIDQLKQVVRQSPLLDRSRQENSAEHSWHLAMYALVLADEAAGSIDVMRVLKMLLIHDIVEIDAGDMPIHGAVNHQQAALEHQAANRLFGLLPDELGADLRQLWHEFEAAETDDAKFAKALDRFQPVLANIVTGGGTWTVHAVSEEKVIERCRPAIEAGAPGLWALAEGWIADHYGDRSNDSRSCP